MDARAGTRLYRRQQRHQRGSTRRRDRAPHRDPGPCAAYKIGQLKIRELRTRAEHPGSGFDVREFHTLVPSNGALPLDVLEANVNR
jgi:hypothetical protein